MTDNSLYFLALLPPEPIAGEVTLFKQQAADLFQAKRALNSPPHITLISPITLGTEDVSAWQQVLMAFVQRQQSFPISLKNFAAFPPRVIFVAIEPNPALDLLQGTLANQLQQELGWRPPSAHPGFHPHITIAFKDLRSHQFPAAWAWFSQETYARMFIAHTLTMLSFQEGRWHVFSEFPFAA